MRKLIAACLVLAAASLLLPSEPSYDPLAWLIWSRELAHFQLDTVGGPCWKPLPVVVTALLAPAGAIDHGLPAALWMVIARGDAARARPGRRSDRRRRQHHRLPRRPSLIA